MERFKKVMFTLVKSTGKLAPKELGEARISFCRTKNNGQPCEYLGEVEPFPGVVGEGCLHCGCPFETKAYMIWAFGKEVKCPHPEGNLWAEIDHKFKI